MQPPGFMYSWIYYSFCHDFRSIQCQFWNCSSCKQYHQEENTHGCSNNKIQNKLMNKVLTQFQAGGILTKTKIFTCRFGFSRRTKNRATSYSCEQNWIRHWMESLKTSQDVLFSCCHLVCTQNSVFILKQKLTSLAVVVT